MGVFCFFSSRRSTTWLNQRSSTQRLMKLLLLQLTHFFQSSRNLLLHLELKLSYEIFLWQDEFFLNFQNSSVKNNEFLTNCPILEHLLNYQKLILSSYQISPLLHHN